MTLRAYLVLMAIGTLLCWVTWIFVIYNISPLTAGSLGFLFFYISLFLAMVGTISVVGFLIRRLIIQNDEAIFRQIGRLFRQSILVSGLVIVAMIMLGVHLLTWWNGLLLIVLGIVVEGIFFANRKYRNVDYVV